ncbi:hypothetical protein AB6V67_12315 [Serratia marcescens]|uniref:hypothetical protein n=1 Tax=Serratia marcescens TaxID=615 RepID=UPI00345C3FBC
MKRVSDTEKLEGCINNMLSNGGKYTSVSTCVIGKTQDKVITITVYSCNAFEREFNEHVDDIADNNFCLE